MSPEEATANEHGSTRIFLFKLTSMCKQRPQAMQGESGVTGCDFACCGTVFFIPLQGEILTMYKRHGVPLTDGSLE